MSGKLYTSGLFTTVIIGGIVGASMIFALGGSNHPMGNGGIIAGVAAGTAALVFLLNTIGLNIGRKSLGGAGLLLSLALIGVGTYLLVDRYGKHPDLKQDAATEQWNIIAAGISVGAGFLGVLGSLGVVSAA